MNNILLTPTVSSVNSREQVDTSVKFNRFMLDIPIIASPMKGITSLNLIHEIGGLGGIGIIHRFQSDDEKKFQIQKLYDRHVKYGLAVGLFEYDLIKYALDHGVSLLCVDIANGYLIDLHNFCRHVAAIIQQCKYKCDLMTGNVVTNEGATALVDSGVDIIRVGIGTGGLCSTRDVTGVGYPYHLALQECSQIGTVIADGGMKTSGDIVKALAMGASAVMIGSMFGTTIESSHNGIIRGMASRGLQEEHYHFVKSVEGIEKKAEKTTTMKQLITELVWGIKSACTYLNCDHIEKLSRVKYVILPGD